MKKVALLFFVIFFFPSFYSCNRTEVKREKVIKLPPVVIKGGEKPRISGESPSPFNLSAYGMASYLKYKYFISHGDIENAYKALEEFYYEYPQTEVAGRVAKMAYILRKYDDASYYGEIFLQEKFDPEIAKIVADSYFRIGKIEKAEKFFNLAYSKNPYDTLVIMRLIQIGLIKGNLEKVDELLERIKEAKPTLYHYVKSRLYLKRSNRNAAIKELETLYSINPDFLPGIKDLVTLYVVSGQLKKAEKLLKSVLASHPEWLELRMFLAQVYEIEKKGERARAELLRLKRGLKTSSWRLDFAIAFTYINEGKFQDAIQILENLEKTYPNVVPIKLYLAFSYANVSQYEKALQVLNSIKKPGNFFPAVSLLKATILYQIGEKDEVKKVLMNLIKKFPSPDAYTFLADVYQGEREYEKEIAVLKEGLKKFPDNVSLLYKLGIAYDYEKKYDKALECMKKILKSDPGNPDALNYIGYYYAEQGIRLDEAEEYIQKALKKKPDDPYIIDSLGWVYYKKGEIQKAKFYLEKAVSLLKNPEPEIFEHMGDIYFKLGRYEDAYEFYERSYQNYSSPEKKDRVLKKIKKTRTYLDKSSK